MTTDPTDGDRYFVYLYRDARRRIRYVGYATKADRAFTDGHNELVEGALGRGEVFDILIAGPFRDEAEARNVEASLVSAIEPALNKIDQPGIKFRPLGVPAGLADRRMQPRLNVHELGRRTGGALVVCCSLDSTLKSGTSKVSPTNFTDDVVFSNIQDHWMVKKYLGGWIENPETSPKILVAVQGKPTDRIVIGSAQIKAEGWTTTPVAPWDKKVHRIPLDREAGLDNSDLRGRRVDIKFGTGPANTIMWVDGTGYVHHGYRIKGTRG